MLLLGVWEETRRLGLGSEEEERMGHGEDMIG